MKTIECELVIDGITDKPVSDARIVISDDGNVMEAGPREEVSRPDSATIVDHSESVVMPGMTDPHVHVSGWRSMDPDEWVFEDPGLVAARATRDLYRIIGSGVTTIRGVGSQTGFGHETSR